ncbi:MAG: UDP-N-acetylmuramoyl-L-alanine--D-glutamate ligase, partial [Verrucomicrobiae bacterium]|nr:UDP-N-acetylmuramoyl-L-alanine--D-glutamate ligase [Verrucomicrobiae bacterium]
LGGQGKGEEYAPLAEAVKSEAVAAVVLGAEKERIVKALKEAAFPHIHEVSSMEEAVQTASTLAFPQSTVLLSPACTSWDMYPNYKKRGEHFQQLVLALEDEK